MPQQMGMPPMGMPQQMGMPPMGMPQQMGMSQQMDMPPQMSQEDIVNKYGENYNGPIEMVGGGKIQEMVYMLNDNKSSGQKKKTPISKNERTKQSGGAGRIIPKYIGDKNTPFKSREEKNIATTRYNEANHPPKEKPPMVEFKLNNVMKPPMPHNQGMYPSAYVPIQNQYLPDGYPYVQGAGNNPYFTGSGIHNQYPYWFVPNNVPVVKNYNISLPNPVGDHVKLADLYEDMLPNTGKYNNTSITLEERLIIYNYVRQVLVRIGDGEDINVNESNIMETTNRKNLLSYLKLLDLNPYHNSRFTNNPYLSLPKKMLMYRSCYPMKLDPTTKKTTCSKYSIGLNLRIYEMTAAEYNIRKLNNESNEMKHKEFNLWREVAFYEYIKEEILKKNICPNFPIIYSWFISGGTEIDFNGLKGLQNKYGQIDGSGKPLKNTIDNAKREALQLEYQQNFKKYIANDERFIKLSMDGSPYHFDGYGFLVDNKNTRVADNANFKNKAFNKKEQELINLSIRMKHNGQIEIKLADLDKPAHRCLLILTEAPNYNIVQWATKTYEHEVLGPVKTMIQTGYHPINVWMNVLFQLLVALHVMQRKEITFFEMTLEDNVYIKDLMNNEQTVGYWKYIIDGFEYFIPNQGFLLFIDSNYKDIEKNRTSGGIWSKPDNKEDKDIFKVYGNVDPEYEQNKNNPIINTSSVGTPVGGTTYKQQFDNMHSDNIKNIFNESKFSLAFTNNGGIKPDGKILSRIKDIHNDVQSNTDLLPVIQKYMTRFLHNRVGTAVSTAEKERGIDTSSTVINPEKGKLYATNTSKGLIWVIYKDRDTTTGKLDVFSRQDLENNNSDVVNVTLPPGSLYEYKSFEPIEQKYKANEVKLGEDELLETYRID